MGKVRMFYVMCIALLFEAVSYAAPLASPEVAMMMLVAMEHDVEFRINRKNDIRKRVSESLIFLKKQKELCYQALGQLYQHTMMPHDVAVAILEHRKKIFEKNGMMVGKQDGIWLTNINSNCAVLSSVQAYQRIIEDRIRQAEQNINNVIRQMEQKEKELEQGDKKLELELKTLQSQLNNIQKTKKGVRLPEETSKRAEKRKKEETEM